MIFLAAGKKTYKKACFFLHSVTSPHRTAKPSPRCLPLAHPRALPAVVDSDRRSPSAMYEFPFECWGCERTHPAARKRFLNTAGTFRFSLVRGITRSWPPRPGGYTARDLGYYFSQDMGTSQHRMARHDQSCGALLEIRLSLHCTAGLDRAPCPIA